MFFFVLLNNAKVLKKQLQITFFFHKFHKFLQKKRQILS